MNTIDIKISISALKHYSASLQRTVGKKTLLLMIKSFSEYILELYGRLIEEEIYSTRYRGEWEPVHDEEYLKYIGTVPRVHIILLLRAALECKKIGNNFIIRINPEYQYPDSDLRLVKVVRAIEDGTSSFNARPMLKKLRKKIQDNILTLWSGYLTIKKVI